jgi:tRNA (guanine-N7-)-methyltransferase
MNSPTPAFSSLVYSPPSYFKPLELSHLFVQPTPFEVELGSGDGSFLIQYAKAHPEVSFLGVERLLGRLRKIDRKGRRAGLANVRALRIEASYCLEYLLPPRSAQAIHVYFPDPWPKRKHWMNRLINEPFVRGAARVLGPGGVVYLRTDDAPYFAQMESAFAASAAFRKVETPRELSEVLTDFERDFRARGIATLSTAYQLASTQLDNRDARVAAVEIPIPAQSGMALQ